MTLWIINLRFENRRILIENIALSVAGNFNDREPFYASNQQAYTAILEETFRRFSGQKAQEKRNKKRKTFNNLKIVVYDKKNLIPKKFIIPKNNTEIIEELSKYYKFLNHGPGVENFGGLVNPLSTWMSSKEGFEFEENMVVSILDYHFGIVWSP